MTEALETSPAGFRRIDGATVVLSLLAAAIVIRVWLMALPSSFWLDECATVFVARHGSNHPSLLDAAPQAWRSWYYPLIGLWGGIFGFSEISLRLPSVLAMLGVLALLARLSARLIHPRSGWFAVFACFALRGFNYQAANARPYALGMCLFAAGLLFLVRWLNSSRWTDAVLFLACAASVVYVHLLFWPASLVFALYAVTRVASREARIGWPRLALVFLLWGLALTPVLLQTLSLLREAQAHVIAAPPSAVQVLRSLKIPLLLVCGLGAWMIARVRHWRLPGLKLTLPALVLAAGWWLCQPLLLAGFSWLTHDSVFVPRYLELALPGMALAATACASVVIPADQWRRLSILLAIGVLIYLRPWRELWPMHHGSDWRGAAAAVRRVEQTAAPPVICPSPFIEARPPAWRPDYPLPGFLYAHLDVYPIASRAYLFPFADSPQAQSYASQITADLIRSRRFLIYGWEPQVHFWRNWFARNPAFQGWQMSRIGPPGNAAFGDVDVVQFSLPSRDAPGIK